MLEERGLSATRIDGAAALAPSLDDHNAILICTQEGLTVELRDALLAYVRGQPSWARLPFVLIVDATQHAWKISASLEGLISECNITILHRPMRHLEFFTAVEAAVRARRWQLEINAHLELQAELRRELNHRVKNTLSTILAIYRLSMAQSEDLTEFADRFDHRVRSLVAVHDLLQDSESGRRDISEIASAVLSPYLAGSREPIEIGGPPCDLGRRSAMALALILNELATNAAKYGALSRPSGSVGLKWSERPSLLEFRWSERGGPSIVPPEKTGYGTRFIESSVQSLGGEHAFDFERSGLRFTMSIPAQSLSS